MKNVHFWSLICSACRFQHAEGMGQMIQHAKWINELINCCCRNDHLIRATSELKRFLNWIEENSKRNKEKESSVCRRAAFGCDPYVSAHISFTVLWQIAIKNESMIAMCMYTTTEMAIDWVNGYECHINDNAFHCLSVNACVRI